MKQIKDIKNKLEWEKYYDPDFKWYNFRFYDENVLSKEFFREFQNKVAWWWISKYQTLSEEFIREFKDKVNWEIISKYQTLSEDFIREFKDKVDWEYISEYQKLSENFKKELNIL